jgi:hypothetical protein
MERADWTQFAACASFPTLVRNSMGQPAAKLSVSVPGELAEAVRKRVGAKGLSGFVARALAHELEREGIGALLVELEEQLGPPSKADLTRARKAWPKR